MNPRVCSDVQPRDRRGQWTLLPLLLLLLSTVLASPTLARERLPFDLELEASHSTVNQGTDSRTAFGGSATAGERIGPAVLQFGIGTRALGTSERPLRYGTLPLRVKFFLGEDRSKTFFRLGGEACFLVGGQQAVQVGRSEFDLYSEFDVRLDATVGYQFSGETTKPYIAIGYSAGLLNVYSDEYVDILLDESKLKTYALHFVLGVHI